MRGGEEMNCNLEKPKACFNCPYSDCIEDSEANEQEEKLILEFRNPPTKKVQRKRAAWKAYYMAHRDELRDYYRKYRQTNKERLKSYRRAYYLAHREETLERQRIYDQRRREQKDA
jgi:hypothetical protein